MERARNGKRPSTYHTLRMSALTSLDRHVDAWTGRYSQSEEGVFPKSNQEQVYITVDELILSASR
jgi:hypothetical protein